MTTLIALTIGIAMGAVCYIIGFRFGCNRGRDEQRIDDIIEMWSRTQDRAALGEGRK